MVKAVRGAADESPIDLLQVEYQQMVPLVLDVPAKKSILDLHNVESALVDSYARARRGVPAALLRAEAAALRRMERRTIGAFDHVVVVSERERARLTAGARSVLVCPNGREPSAILPDAPDATVAFVATMGWAPNVDAAVWLGREIWPEVLTRVPEARLLLVGKDPAPAVRALADEHIEVTGTVADVSPFLARSRVVVAPLRAGGGTRLKIMEALDVGRPVVATSLGCEGMEDLVGRGVVVADTACGAGRGDRRPPARPGPRRGAGPGRPRRGRGGPHMGRRTGAAHGGGAVLLLVLAGIAGLGLGGGGRRALRPLGAQGKEQLVPLVLLGLLVVEATLYADPNIIPRGLFHPDRARRSCGCPRSTSRSHFWPGSSRGAGRPGSACRPASGWPSPRGWRSAPWRARSTTTRCPRISTRRRTSCTSSGAYALAAGVPVRRYFDSGDLFKLGTSSSCARPSLDLMTLAGVSVNTNLPLLPLSSSEWSARRRRRSASPSWPCASWSGWPPDRSGCATSSP